MNPTAIRTCHNFNDLSTQLRSCEVKGNSFRKFLSVVFGTGVEISLGKDKIVVDRAKMHMGSAKEMHNWVTTQLTNIKASSAEEKNKLDNAVREISRTTGRSEITGDVRSMRELFDTLSKGGIEVKEFKDKYTRGSDDDRVTLTKGDIDNLKLLLKDLYTKIQSGKAPRVDKAHAQDVSQAVTGATSSLSTSTSTKQEAPATATGYSIKTVGMNEVFGGNILNELNARDVKQAVADFKSKGKSVSMEDDRVVFAVLYQFILAEKTGNTKLRSSLESGYERLSPENKQRLKDAISNYDFEQIVRTDVLNLRFDQLAPQFEALRRLLSK